MSEIMANTDEFNEFESHFLDSMLEVEMTEEEGEVNVTQAESITTVPSKVDLPPVPRFDLQSDSLTYKNVYNNPSISIKAKPAPISKPARIVAPCVQIPAIQATPVFIVHSNVKSNTNVKPKSSTLQRSLILRNLLTKAGQEQMFLQKVFQGEFVQKVFSEKENCPDLKEFGEEENEYYKSVFQDVSNVHLCKLHCTICSKHLGCGKDAEKRIKEHNMLKVLTCKLCNEFYGDGNFPCDEVDHCEIYCRWCGQGGALVCCSFCPKVFCKRCVSRNYSRAFLRAIERATDWACFCCAQKPLWPHRAICRALLEYFKERKTTRKFSLKDTSVCCKSLVVNKKIVSQVDRNKIFLSGGETLQLGSGAKEAVKISKDEVTNKVTTSVSKHITGNVHSNLKNSQTPLKVSDVNKSVKVSNVNKMSESEANKITITTATSTIVTPVTTISTTASTKTTTTIIKKVPVSVKRKIAPAPVVTNNFQKISNVIPITTSLKGLPIPHLINGPVYHGQTLISPPGTVPGTVPIIVPTNPTEALIDRKPTIISNRDQTTPNVKVSVSDWVNVDINKVPVAKIPHNVQGVLLRLNFPDNKVQLVRLVTEDHEPKTFPMPKFGDSETLDFLEGNLEDSFKLTKMLFERLMAIKQTVNSTTKYNKDSVYYSSVQKLSFIYEKARELMEELDENLLNNYENWKKGYNKDKDIQVIDISDEEKKKKPPKKRGRPGKLPRLSAKVSRNIERPSIFKKKTGIFTQDDDSDIEMIVATSGNLLTSQRTLRSSTKKMNNETIARGNLNSNIKAEPSDVSPAKSRTSKTVLASATSSQQNDQKRAIPPSAVLDKSPDNVAAKKRKMLKDKKKVVTISDNEDSETAAVEKDPLALSDEENKVTGVSGNAPINFQCNIKSEAPDSQYLSIVTEIKEETLDLD